MYSCSLAIYLQEFSTSRCASIMGRQVWLVPTLGELRVGMMLALVCPPHCVLRTLHVYSVARNVAFLQQLSVPKGTLLRTPPYNTPYTKPVEGVSFVRVKMRRGGKRRETQCHAPTSWPSRTQTKSWAWAWRWLGVFLSLASTIAWTSMASGPLQGGEARIPVQHSSGVWPEQRGDTRICTP